MRFLYVIFCLLAGCARAPITSPVEAMRPSPHRRAMTDDMELPSLLRALEANVKQLRVKKDAADNLFFGPRQISRADYADALEYLLKKSKEDASIEKFIELLNQKFEPYEVYGKENWGEVFITSYYEPIIEGDSKKSTRFSQPLYGVPRDLVNIDLKTFANLPLDPNQKYRDSILRGRLVSSPDDKISGRVVAFPERKKIEEEGNSFAKNAEILAWVDPIDAFFLEIQGSGVIKMKNGKELKLGYAAQNGHPYVAIGKELMSNIPKEKITLQSIENHLRSLNPEEMRKILNVNPSYVFFQKLQSRGLTYFGTQVETGRTIATDPNFFPKGALAYLEFDKPKFQSPQDTEPSAWERSSRFVLDQDTGGAIRGPARVDLFWGQGKDAKQSAGVMKSTGNLIYMVPKAEFLRELKG